MASLASGGGKIVADLWTTAPITLDQLCTVLSHTLGVGPFQHDCENVWEWGYAQVEGGHLEVNVTRKHEDGEPLPEEPIRVILLVSGKARPDWADGIRATWLPRIGQALANATGTIAYSGHWRYLRDDDFELEVQREFTPAGGRTA